MRRFVSRALKVPSWFVSSSSKSFLGGLAVYFQTFRHPHPGDKPCAGGPQVALRMNRIVVLNEASDKPMTITEAQGAIRCLGQGGGPCSLAPTIGAGVTLLIAPERSALRASDPDPSWFRWQRKVGIEVQNVCAKLWRGLTEMRSDNRVSNLHSVVGERVFRCLGSLPLSRS